MKDFVSIEKKIWEEKKKYFENYLEWGKRIKAISQKFLDRRVRVLIFGSVVKGEWTPNSDIDVLIISPKLSKNWIKNRKIRTEIKKLIDPTSPFQIHLAHPDEFKSWWKKFVKKDYIEIK
jgi:predicted nucleotidyltransferase